MRLKLSIMIPGAIVLGLAAVQSGRAYLDRAAGERARAMDIQPRVQPQAFSTIVVAALPLRYGAELAPNMVKEIPWASDQLPKGAFSKVKDLLASGGKRYVLSAIEDNEAVLDSKITGSGQKANLAALIEEGKKAVTVRVDDIVGVAGFVLPGDRVDILLTRRQEDRAAVSDVVLQNIKVLGIDQKADDRLDKPSVARAVTLEVSTQQAQRLNVAQSVGALSLVLRPVGGADQEPSRRITSAQIAGTDEITAAAPATDIGAAPAGRSTVINVIRRADRKEYSVPVDRR